MTTLQWLAIGAVVVIAIIVYVYLIYREHRDAPWR